jgi:hypothetical protein
MVKVRQSMKLAVLIGTTSLGAIKEVDVIPINVAIQGFTP